MNVPNRPGCRLSVAIRTALIASALGLPLAARSAPLPGGTLDPTIIPKYVSPLVIPPEMPKSTNSSAGNDYEIAVREFKQQILPKTGCSAPAKCVNGAFMPTKVWGYGRAEDSVPSVAPSLNSTFNFPAFTIEAKSNVTTKIRWINDLVKPGTRAFRPHLFWRSLDQTLHWANPPKDCIMGAPRTDCAGQDPHPYRGPVPIVTHVHGAHVEPHSDGYPEAWWLPNASNIPAGYATAGTLFDDATGSNPGDLGYVDYRYINTQDETTLWYHDHALGITRLNVYSGLAGFYLLRDPVNGQEKNLNLPGPAPKVGDAQGNNPFGNYFEIPIVIQDRSFNRNGSLFYPKDRAFFEGLKRRQLDVDFIPDSDMSPIWNPEAFFNVMVVNGVAWPYLNVEPRQYRFRLLNGTNSRFLNLSLKVVNPNGTLGQEVPIYQIGSDGGLLPHVVEVKEGFKTILPGNGTIPPSTPAADPQEALLIEPASRDDVIVDFAGLPAGTHVRMVNTAPDAPFGGFPDVPADPSTTGQVMEFIVGATISDPSGADPSTPVENLQLAPRASLPPVDNVRQLSLNEEESSEVCVITLADGSIQQLRNILPGPNFVSDCTNAGGVPYAPKQALLGTIDPLGNSLPQLWSDPLTENPAVGATEIWELHNLTEDAHPIHVHLVQYQIVNREDLITGAVRPPEPTELGWKDTVIAYPGEITRFKAHFDIPGLYVWHCHILEHEDNEMMRPFCVGNAGTDCPVGVF